MNREKDRMRERKMYRWVDINTIVLYVIFVHVSISFCLYVSLSVCLFTFLNERKKGERSIQVEGERDTDRETEVEKQRRYEGGAAAGEDNEPR